MTCGGVTADHLSSLSRGSDPRAASARPWIGRGGLLLLYALAFHAAHRSALIWGGSSYFSLLYPAAGIRLALLWWGGARWTPGIVAAELAVQAITGVIFVGPHAPWIEAANVVRPPLLYGLVVAGVRRVERRPGNGDLATPPMPFALAATLAPIATAFATLGLNAVWPGGAYLPLTEPQVLNATIMLVGDMLGVLLVTPTLLWLAAAIRSGRPGRLEWPPRLAEGAIIFALAWLLTLAIRQSGGALLLTPVLLATAWIGLRSGRGAAWAAIIVTAAAALPASATIGTLGAKLALHMELAAVAVAGYLAGSFTDAQKHARAAIDRRDRMLFQAERLKTLRAMSVAVIHEISQPLSTLSIEARHLAAIGADPAADRAEIAGSAALVARKVLTLAEMVRRLRRFGGRAVDEPSPLPVTAILAEVRTLIGPEARRAGVRLSIPEPDPTLIAFGQEIELVQAVVNLVRNAVAAAPGGEIAVTTAADGAMIGIVIVNPILSGAPDPGGMGVGSLIARTIIEAHGGRLTRERKENGHVVHAIRLPRADRDRDDG